MKVVEYWHGTIKNYRYDGDVSGVPQNETPWDTVHLHRQPPPASTGYYSSTVDLLQPPRAPVHPASTVRYSTG